MPRYLWSKSSTLLLTKKPFTLYQCLLLRISALAHTEQLLWTAIIKDGGSHSGKQRYLLLYQTSSWASSVTASWVCQVPWHSETHTSLNTSPFLETALPPSTTKLHTSSMRNKVGATLHVHVHTLILLCKAWVNLDWTVFMLSSLPCFLITSRPRASHAASWS